MNVAIPSNLTEAPIDQPLDLLAPPDAATISPHDPVVAADPIQPFALAARLTIIVVGVVAFLFLARAVVLPAILAWVLAMALKPPLRWLGDLHVPAPLAAGAILLVLLASAAWGFTQLVRPAMAWIEEAPANVVVLKQRLVSVLRPAQRLREAAVNAGKMDGTTASASTVEVGGNDLTGTVFTWTSTALVGLGETVALLFLLLAAGDSFLHKLVRVMPTFADKRRAVDIMHQIQQGISAYLFSIGLINFGFGLAVALALALTGMPQPIMWGLVAAVLNFIPYFGPVLGVGLMGMAGLLAFDTLGLGLLPAALYLGLHLLEANLVTPLLVGRRVTLNPVMVFGSLMFFVWLWGGPGAFVAVPLLVTARVACERIPSLAPVAEFLSR